MSWQSTVASFFGGPGDEQPVAGPFPRTGAMNTAGPLYVALPHAGEAGRVPFGTTVEVAYGGRTVRAVVADKGPNDRLNRGIDLGYNTALALGFPLSKGVDTVQYRILSGADVTTAQPLAVVAPAALTPTTSSGLLGAQAFTTGALVVAAFGAVAIGLVAIALGDAGGKGQQIGKALRVAKAAAV